jgi:hypothetical protein
MKWIKNILADEMLLNILEWYSYPLVDALSASTDREP